MTRPQNQSAQTRSGDPGAAAGKHIRGSSLLLIGRLIGVVLNFAIQIIIVRHLAKADYGAFAYAFAFMMFASHIVGVGLAKSLSRFVPIYQERREYEKMAGTIVLVLGTIVACGAALVALVYGLRGVIGERVAPDPLALSLLLIFVCMAPVQALDNLTVRLFAIFASPRSVFLRRYVLTPGLKLAAVLALVFFQGGAVFLTVAYLIAGILGVAISLVVIAGVLRDQDLLRHFRRGGFRMPTRSVLRFGLPLLSSDLVHALRGTLVVVFLGFFHSSMSVAAFRAVLPVARLNIAVFDSFKLLFVPTAGRMYARGDREGLNELYWRTASWIVVFTFPIFAISFAFSEPLTLLLFGERYGDSATVLRVLAVGIFVNAAFGFNVRTLQVFHKVRTILRIDVTVMSIAIMLNILLIREFGALGGAAASCGVLILQNVLYQAALFRARAIEPMDARFLKVLLTVLAVTASLFAIQSIFSPPIVLAAVTTAIASLLVVRITGPLLDVDVVFPEIRRFAAACWLLGIREGAGESGGGGSPAASTDAQALARQLRERAGHYFDTRGPVEVRLTRTQVRFNWTLYHFDARADEAHRGVVVKVAGGRRQSRRRAGGAPGPLPDELRLFPLAPASDRARLEAAALSRIHAYFADRGDPRFGTIRMLEYLASYRAVVMEESPDPRLDSLLEAYRSDGSAPLGQVFRNVGAWLHVFHKIPPADGVEVRNAKVSDFHEAVDRFADYLLEIRTGTRFPPALRDRMHAAADAVLPKSLPLGVIHGDFVPGNVLVAADERVAVFDTRSQWLAPTYEDIARFLVALEDSNGRSDPRSLGHSAGPISGYGEEFLRGYFESEPVPMAAIRVFEAQRLLWMWVAAGYQHEAAGGLRRLRKRHVLARNSGPLHQRVESILRKVSDDG